jgi:nucleotide-binding universal stress UspA family protein
VSNRSEKRAKSAFIGCLIVAITLFHLGTPRHLMYLHVLLQALFFAPVSLAGFWFGKKGGLVAALAIAGVYIHHAITVMMPTSTLAVSNAIQIVLIFIVGLLTGTYADVRLGYQEAISKTSPPSTAALPSEQKLLVYLDESGAAMNAVRYVAHLFGRVPDVKVTLLSVRNRTSPELTGQNRAQRNAESSAQESSEHAVEKARELLFQSGFTDSRLEARVVEQTEGRISDVILMEQKAGNHSAIVIGRHNLSRAEEFLFGSVAVRLARQATCPVWVIDESLSIESAA